ncbi:MAG: uroporphyrinogen decarboxylase family protein [Calditrichia bacterium]
MSMTGKERLFAALQRRKPDRLPVTTHHVMPYFLEKYMNGISCQEFFDYFGLDPILWLAEHRPDESKGACYDPGQGEPGFLQPRWIVSDAWRIERETLSGFDYETVRYYFITPQKKLSMSLQSNEYTSWVSERLVKEKTDIDLIAKYAPAPLCDVKEVNRKAAGFGQRGMVRGFIPGFEIYGQAGCWQDAAVLYGIENLIMETFTDPEWVHTFLKILQERKKVYLGSMQGAAFDVIEHGGGDASSTVISPQIFDEFIAPYDEPLIQLAHEMGQRVVYHTCGGMMPLLERIAEMAPDAMETFTPPDMGGDTDLAAAKERIGERVCMIGGFDQFHFFKDSTPEATRREVRRCFEAAGEGGGYILSPSDHFFEADPELIAAFADEARKCVYNQAR